MRWYPQVQAAIKTTLPFLLATQATNLALLVSALLAKRTVCLSELARAYPRPEPAQRRVAQPKHDRLHRVKRLWRFLGNERVDPLAVQVALIPSTVAALGCPRGLGLAIDWTDCDVRLPTGRAIRYQVLRIAVPRRGRALPLLQLADDRDHLPADHRQNQREAAARRAVVPALPQGVRPVILADRGLARADFLAWLHQQGGDAVVRLPKGVCVTESEGRRWKLGEAGPGTVARGERRWAPQGRLGLYHGRPRALTIPRALSWRPPRHQTRQRRRSEPDEPWYLATSLAGLRQAVAWYQQRFWIEESFKDSTTRFRLNYVQVGCPQRLSRLLLALTIALSWLTLAALPAVGGLPSDWAPAVAQWGRASVISLALTSLETFQE